MAFVSDKTWDKNSCNCFTHKYRVHTRIALEIKQFYQVFILYAGIKKILFTLENPFFCRACLRHGALKRSDFLPVRPFVRPSVNICDHPSVDPTVQVHNFETL